MQSQYYQPRFQAQYHQAPYGHPVQHPAWIQYQVPQQVPMQPQHRVFERAETYQPDPQPDQERAKNKGKCSSGKSILSWILMLCSMGDLVFSWVWLMKSVKPVLSYSAFKPFYGILITTSVLLGIDSIFVFLETFANKKFEKFKGKVASCLNRDYDPDSDQFSFQAKIELLSSILQDCVLFIAIWKLKDQNCIVEVATYADEISEAKTIKIFDIVFTAGTIINALINGGRLLVYGCRCCRTMCENCCVGLIYAVIYLAAIGAMLAAIIQGCVYLAHKSQFESTVTIPGFAFRLSGYVSMPFYSVRYDTYNRAVGYRSRYNNNPDRATYFTDILVHRSRDKHSLISYFSGSSDTFSWDPATNQETEHLFNISTIDCEELFPDFLDYIFPTMNMSQYSCRILASGKWTTTETTELQVNVGYQLTPHPGAPPTAPCICQGFSDEATFVSSPVTYSDDKKFNVRRKIAGKSGFHWHQKEYQSACLSVNSTRCKESGVLGGCATPQNFTPDTAPMFLCDNPLPYCWATNHAREISLKFHKTSSYYIHEFPPPALNWSLSWSDDADPDFVRCFLDHCGNSARIMIQTVENGTLCAWNYKYDPCRYSNCISVWCPLLTTCSSPSTDTDANSAKSTTTTTLSTTTTTSSSTTITQSTTRSQKPPPTPLPLETSWALNVDGKVCSDDSMKLKPEFPLPCTC